MLRIGGTRILQILGLAFGLIGLGLLVVAAVTAVGAVRFEQHAERAVGKVIDVSVERSCNGTKRHRCTITYRPTIEFRTADQQRVIFTSKVSTSAHKEIGDRVQVLYRADDPDDARLAGGALFVPTFVTGGIGVLLLASGVIMTAVWVRRARGAPPRRGLG